MPRLTAASTISAFAACATNSFRLNSRLRRISWAHHQRRRRPLKISLEGVQLIPPRSPSRWQYRAKRASSFYSLGAPQAARWGSRDYARPGAAASVIEAVQRLITAGRGLEMLWSIFSPKSMSSSKQSLRKQYKPFRESLTTFVRDGF